MVDADTDDLYDQFISHEKLKGLFRASSSPRELMAPRLRAVGPFQLPESASFEPGLARCTAAVGPLSLRSSSS